MINHLMNKKISNILISVLSLSIYFSVYANSVERQQVTALFLYNFANFVEWPKKAFENSRSPLRMCLFGNIGFAPMLGAFDGALIGERELSVLITGDIKKIENGCHILFVGEDQQKNLPMFFKQIQYLYVLSVSEQEDFVNQGGVISIVNTSKQLQFDINLSVASANRLSISSDLLSLAREIKRLKN